MTSEQRPEGVGVACSALLGLWRLKHRLPMRMGHTCFECAAGAACEVTAADGQMVMLHVGKHCDWVLREWLERNFEKVSQ